MKVSCVIPAYENMHLFTRCLVSALHQQNVDLEIIVSDDSSSPSIRSFVSLLQNTYPNLRYIDGARSGNPVDNWNKGIASATGQYCVLLHHDEFFVDSHFLARAVIRLDATGEAAVAGVCVVIGLNRRSRFALIRRGARLLRPPVWMIYMVNWIGPTGVVLFRRGVAPSFDRSLIFTVDLHFYYALFTAPGGVGYLTDIALVSLGHHEAQITARHEVRRIHLSELRRLLISDPKTISTLKGCLLMLAVWARSKIP